MHGIHARSRRSSSSSPADRGFCARGGSGRAEDTSAFLTRFCSDLLWVFVFCFLFFFLFGWFSVFTPPRGKGRMSNVRLSNGSPTLERTDARVSDHPKPSACRSLFGSVDHEELKRDLKGHLQEMEEAASAKWGFDFASHTPLADGRFEWQVVDCRDVPEFYGRQRNNNNNNNNRGGGGGVDLNGNRSSCVLVAARQTTEDGAERAAAAAGPPAEPCAGQRKRPACHDPSAQSKRSHTSSDEVRGQPLTRSAEHAPRKSSPSRQT
ncbi:cyclin dependent kinase inhibitor 1Bb [Lampris incognitus]|uniref:cyclin dependent kinase inhibitor 1Bb n=1 Tax=Lampris incognitus TaxID=2546036 RepID=UPI0024B61B17|nr:cyclin dependent kinase inhibitor 1Bb [Lampris incognitus]